MSYLIGNLNNGLPYFENVIPISTNAFTKPYPKWIYMIDANYNNGLPYLIGLRPPPVIVDGYIDGYGVKTIWTELLKKFNKTGSGVAYSIPSNKYLDGQGLKILTQQAKILLEIPLNSQPITIPNSRCLDGNGLVAWWGAICNL